MNKIPRSNNMDRERFVESQDARMSRPQQREQREYEVDSVDKRSEGSKRRVKGAMLQKLIGLVLVCAVLYGVYTLYQNYFSDPKAKAEQQTADILSKVSSLMIIPTGETPAVFDITDPDTLVKQQQFFAGAIKGDKLIVFSKSAKAIIYSPSRNKIVNSGPVSVDATAAMASSTSSLKK